MDVSQVQNGLFYDFQKVLLNHRRSFILAQTNRNVEILSCFRLLESHPVAACFVLYSDAKICFNDTQ